MAVGGRYPGCAEYRHPTQNNRFPSGRHFGMSRTLQRSSGSSVFGVPPLRGFDAGPTARDPQARALRFGMAIVTAWAARAQPNDVGCSWAAWHHPTPK